VFREDRDRFFVSGACLRWLVSGDLFSGLEWLRRVIADLGVLLRQLYESCVIKTFKIYGTANADDWLHGGGRIPARFHLAWLNLGGFDRVWVDCPGYKFSI